MDMQIDRKKVRAERTMRAWSQEHLAEASNLSLRTIQRIESSGTASFESVKALAAVFELSSQQLVSSNAVDVGTSMIGNQTLTSKQYFSMRALAATFFAAAALSSALFLSNSSWAEQIMLDIDLSYDGDENTEIIQSQLLTKEGKDAEVRINDVVRVVVSPSVEEDGRVFLDVKIFEAVAGDYELLFEPKMITSDKKEAELRVTGGTGTEYRVLITPHRDSNNI